MLLKESVALECSAHFTECELSLPNGGNRFASQNQFARAEVANTTSSQKLLSWHKTSKLQAMIARSRLQFRQTILSFRSTCQCCLPNKNGNTLEKCLR